MKMRDKYIHRVGTDVFTEDITMFNYEGWNFNSGNYLFTTDTK